MEEKPRPQTSLFGPLLLIAVGVVFLLNNMGILPWDIWLRLLRLWPLLIIGAGLDLLIGRKTILGSLISTAILFALLIGGFWLLSTRAEGGDMAVREIYRSTGDAQTARIEIAMGIGQLHIGASETDALIDGTIKLPKNQDIEERFEVRDGQARYVLRADDSWFPDSWSHTGTEQVWQLALGREIPIALEVDAGVGDAMLNLERLNLTGLKVNSGMGKATITLPQRGRFKAVVNGGIGQVIIEVPRGLAVRIRTDIGIGNVTVPTEYQRQGDDYVSPEYKSTDPGIELTIKNGIGKIIVRTYGE